jgi:hypothetical protein
MLEKIHANVFSSLISTKVPKLPAITTNGKLACIGGLFGAALLHLSSSQKKGEANEKPSLWQQFKQKAAEFKVTAEKASKAGITFVKQHRKELAIVTVAITSAALISRSKAGNTLPPLSELQKKANYAQALANAQTQAVIELAQQLSTSDGDRVEPHELTNQQELPRKAQRGAHWLQMKADATEYFEKRQERAALSGPQKQVNDTQTPTNRYTQAVIDFAKELKGPNGERVALMAL